MRRIRWKSILLGVAATFVGLVVMVAVASPFFPVPIPEGEVVDTEVERYARIAFSALVPLFCASLVFFAGGFLSDRLASGFQGFNGLLVAPATMAIVLAFFIWQFVPLLLRPVNNPGEAYTRAENFGNLIELSVIFALAMPPILLASFLGGRLGGRLRGREPANRPAD